MAKLNIIPYQDLSNYKLKQFFPFLRVWLIQNGKVISNDVKWFHFGVRFEDNRFFIYIKDKYKHLYYKKEIPHQFEYVAVDTVLEKLGLNKTFNYFQKSDVEHYVSLQGFTHRYDNQKLFVSMNTNPNVVDLESADSNQLMLFTNKQTDLLTIPLKKGLTDIRELLPNRVKKNVNRKRMGIMIDIASQFYTINYLKKMIDLVARQGGQYLLLRVSNDNAYVLESTVLGQRSNTRRSTINYTHPVTKKHFYSNTQMREVVQYGKKLGIEVIPEISLISRTGGIRKLVNIDAVKKNKNWFNGLTGDFLFSEPDVQLFMKSILDEVNNIFKSNSHRIHIGGDGFTFEEENQYEHVLFFNSINLFLQSRGKIMQIWNEAITKENMEMLSKNIEIYYEHLIPRDVTDAEEQKKILWIRATFPELIGKGFKVYNANYYYTKLKLTYIPTTIDVDYLTRESMLRWHLGVWDKDNRGKEYAVLDKVAGGLIRYTIDPVLGMPEELMYKYLETYLSTMISLGLLTNEEDRTFYLQEMVNDNFALTLFESYLDMFQLAYSDILHRFDFRAPQARKITILNEGELFNSKEMVCYVIGNTRSYITLSSNWIPGIQMDYEGITYTKYTYRESNNVMYLSHEINVEIQT